MTTGADSAPQLDRWNWGAAIFTWIWALGHRLWVYALLGFVLGIIPIVPIIVFGLKGNEWAWARGGYSGVEELREKERKWAIAALIYILVIVAIVVIAVAAG